LSEKGYIGINMKALSFLGTGRYEETTYCWEEGEEERTYTTYLFPEAIARIFQPKRLFIFVTPQAKEHQNFKTLCERLGDLVEPIEIPEGKSEGELWQIFDVCAATFGEGDEILLDITHAFRSLPLLVFTAAAYLRRTKQVNVQRIVYGAFEARDEENRSPIFDMTPLLDLLDWLSGAEAMLRRNDAETLATKLEGMHRRLWRERTVETLPRQLQKVATKLKSLSSTLHLSRPIEVMKAANDLLPMLNDAADELERWAKPFRVIVDKVRDEVAQLARERPDRLDAENMRKQLALIEHYLRKGLVMQAVTLAREWVVSWSVLQHGEGDWRDKDLREQIEGELGAAAQQIRQGQITSTQPWITQEVAELWNWITQLRNDVAHCGMSRQAAPVRSITRRAGELPQRLRSLLDDLPSQVLWSGQRVIDLRDIYGETASLEELPIYLEQVKELAGEGTEVILTGQAPIWLYLAAAHALHGKVRRLLYRSPTTGEVLIFDHTP
jgi:CRISPR-associated DxTHG motif protein